MAMEPSPLRQLHLGMVYLKLGDRNLGTTTIANAMLKDPSLSKADKDW
jgi:hypothetical protein